MSFLVAFVAGVSRVCVMQCVHCAAMVEAFLKCHNVLSHNVFTIHVIINNDLKNLIVIQKLETRTVGLKPI